MEARKDANNEMSKDLRGTLVSQMDIHQARTESTQEEMEDKMYIQQEKMEATIHSIRYELEETIKHRVEDVLACVDASARNRPRRLMKHRWTYRQ
jgi:hypothetical protein